MEIKIYRYAYYKSRVIVSQPIAVDEGKIHDWLSTSMDKEKKDLILVPEFKNKTEMQRYIAGINTVLRPIVAINGVAGPIGFHYSDEGYPEDIGLLKVNTTTFGEIEIQAKYFDPRIDDYPESNKKLRDLLKGNDIDHFIAFMTYDEVLNWKYQDKPEEKVPEYISLDAEWWCFEGTELNLSRNLLPNAKAYSKDKELNFDTYNLKICVNNIDFSKEMEFSQLESVYSFFEKLGIGWQICDNMVSKPHIEESFCELYVPFPFDFENHFIDFVNAIDKTINCGDIYIALGSFDVNALKYGEYNQPKDHNDFLPLYCQEKDQLYTIDYEIEGELAYLFKKHFADRLE